MEVMTREIPCQLCVTHSALVTRVFEAAMSQRCIPTEKTRSLSRRSAPVCGIGLSVDDLSDEMEDCFKSYDRKGFQALLNRLDHTLSELTEGRPFEAYIPHANKILYQEIIFRPNCVGYSYLEEGFTSMAWSTQRNARTSWAKILRSSIRSWRVGSHYRFSRPMFDHTLPGYQAAYAISDSAFKNMPGRQDVVAYLPPLPTGDGLAGHTYIILDALYLFQGIHWEDYENALVKALLSQELPDGEMLIKFHFADAGSAEKYQSLCQKLVGRGTPPLRLLGASYAVEQNLTARDLVVFAYTSLGYYAALMGVRVCCFAGDIQDLPIPSLIQSGKLPADFRLIVAPK